MEVGFVLYKVKLVGGEFMSDLRIRFPPASITPLILSNHISLISHLRNTILASDGVAE
jgi:hypothetical protein